MGFSRDANGWSIITPSGSPVDGFVGNPGSGDTRVIHVSDSDGSDTEGAGIGQGNGSKARPYKTIAKGESRIRSGTADWLLLAAGDTFTNQFINGVSGGANATNRTVRASYDRSENSPGVPNPGTAAPWPLIKTPVGIKGCGVIGANTAVMGLDFYAYTRDPDNPAFNPSNPNLQEVDGGDTDAAATNCLVEDCRFRFYHNNFEIHGQNGVVQELRRCQFTDANNINDKVSVGLGGGPHGPATVTVEQCLFDINGYHPTYNPGGSFLNHNVYANSNNNLIPSDPDKYAVYQLNMFGNIDARGSGNALFSESQVRCGGHFNNNTQFLAGSGGWNYGATNIAGLNLIENEVAFAGFQDGQMINLSGSFIDGHPGYYGLRVPGMPAPILVRNNICTQPKGVGSTRHSAMFQISGDNIGPLYDLRDNICYKYFAQGMNNALVDIRFGGGPATYITSGFNIVTETNTQGWPAPDRDITDYLEEIGLGIGHNLAYYMKLCRAQRKGNWNPLLMAESVNDYTRKGFGRPYVGSAYAGGGTIATGTVTVRDAAGTTASVPVTLNIND